MRREEEGGGREGKREKWIYENTISDLRRVKNVKRIKNKNKKYKRSVMLISSVISLRLSILPTSPP